MELPLAGCRVRSWRPDDATSLARHLIDDRGHHRLTIDPAAHNEAANIGRLLARVGASRLDQVAVAEIIVVASGCTDDTEAAIRNRLGIYHETTRQVIDHYGKKVLARELEDFLFVLVFGVCIVGYCFTSNSIFCIYLILYIVFFFR